MVSKRTGGSSKSRRSTGQEAPAPALAGLISAASAQAQAIEPAAVPTPTPAPDSTPSPAVPTQLLAASVPAASVPATAPPQSVGVAPLASPDPALTPRQIQGLKCLTLGRSIKSAAREAGVGRSTLYRWIKDDPHFRAAYNAWLDELEVSAQGRLANLGNRAIDTLGRALDRDDARVAVSLLKGLNYLSPSSPGPTDPANVRRRQDIEAIDADTQMQEAENHIGYRRLTSSVGSGPGYFEEAREERHLDRKRLPEPKEEKEG